MAGTIRRRWKLLAAQALLVASSTGCTIERSALKADARDAGADARVDSGATDGGDTVDGEAPIDAGCEATELCDSRGDDDCDGLVDEGCGWHFGRSSPLVRLHRSTSHHFSPVLSADNRRLYYRAGVTGGPWLYVAARADVESRFGEPQPVQIVGGDAFTFYSFTVSQDELELIAEAHPAGAVVPTQLYRSVRASTDDPFGMPLEIGVLTAPAPWRNINPHLSRDGTELFFASDRTAALRIWRAVRPAPGMAFEAPELVELSGIATVETTPHLSDDGLTLFFARDWRIWVAERGSTDDAVFGEPRKLMELPDDGSTYFPHLSEDTYEIFFVSERPWSPALSGIWRARVCREGPGPCEEPVIDCPSSGAVSPDGRHCYFTGAGPGTWTEARSDCLAAGGDLVSIHSVEEQELAWGVLSTEAWTGGNDRENECNVMIAGCTFEWTTREPFLYSAWPAGQPSDAGGEDCMVINMMPQRFNDRACSIELPFVCERELWPW